MSVVVVDVIVVIAEVPFDPERALPNTPDTCKPAPPSIPSEANTVFLTSPVGRKQDEDKEEKENNTTRHASHYLAPVLRVKRDTEKL
jgi:hypothetical protein